MRKVVFYIDDLCYFRKEFNLTETQTNDIFNGEDSFKVIYTLYGEEKVINNYELTDYNGNRISLNTLNGYQRGVVLNDCMAYFTGGKYQFKTEKPTGVIKIEETELESEVITNGSNRQTETN